ncbi:helicase-related protein [Undibacterium arcticum]
MPSASTCRTWISLKASYFCVSVAHAQFMANWFEQSGLPARSLTGANTTEQRDDAVRSLRSGEIKLICTCDLFNEGVDIPEINTLLLLRPTQSPVIFFSSRLAVASGWPMARRVASFLDFVGLYAEGFRFDTLFRAITGQTRAQLKDAVEKWIRVTADGMLYPI